MYIETTFTVLHFHVPCLYFSWKPYRNR